MREKLKNLYLTRQELAHYLVMAAIIVSIEYVSYIGMLWLGVHYMLAVPASMAIGIGLNWVGSHKFVFKNRRHLPHKEFTLVLIVSLVGVGFQMGVTFTVVELLGLGREIGKFLAIIVTFFWNYWARKRFIF